MRTVAFEATALARLGYPGFDRQFGRSVLIRFGSIDDAQVTISEKAIEADISEGPRRVIRSGNEGNRFGCLVIRYLLNRYDHRWQAFYRWLSEEKKRLRSCLCSCSQFM